MFDENWLKENHEILSAFDDFLESCGPESEYFLLGSVALLSYTSRTGYLRQIKDIDIIASPKTAQAAREHLLSLGYRQGTFIDKEMPLHQWLVNLAGKKYLRFEKRTAAVEIHVSDFIPDGENLAISLYPRISVSLPADSVIETSLAGRNFKALSPEALFCSYRGGLRTAGIFMRVKTEQKNKDLKQLAEILNPEKLKRIAGQAYFYLGRLKIKIPTFLLV